MTQGHHEGDLLMRAARTLRRRWAHSLVPWELSPHQARALRVICSALEGHEDRPPRLSDVAESLHIAPRSATEVIDSLEAKGLVGRSPSPNDRRSIVVTPTPQGQQVRRAIEQARVEEADDFFAPLDEADRASLAAILRKALDE
ncbi:MarR family winged helix-turn-helix transcriptional regulator [Segeticoccus rhizosphaerae]|jgi:DNA-binding MarR family transcriptional regulator|uniref:MarR family winged helix-turn-helix transcriptional regulator n=1 Tax=Segeticoccus rhizosphaerae TaxID=1104777 RepID=UPI001265538F|nr:MarR family transcriptional regulator [Segeticoccus rhizosphaerae]